MLKGLKSLIFEDDGGDKKQDAIEPDSTVTFGSKRSDTQFQQFSPSAQPSSPQPPVAVDGSKFAAHIDGVFTAANIPGPDYFEFTKGTKALESVIPDRGQRYKATMVAQVGLSKDILLDTAGKYLKIFKEKAAEVDAAGQAESLAATKKIDESLAASVDAVKSFTARIDELELELESARKKVAEKQAEVDGLQKEKDRIAEKIATNATALKQAYVNKAGEIDGDIKLIQSL